MKISGRVASAEEIFAVNAGKLSCILNYGLLFGRNRLARSGGGVSNGGGCFSLRFNF